MTKEADMLDRAPGDVIMANATRSEKLDLRLTPEAKRVLNAAAQASRRSVSEFVLRPAAGSFSLPQAVGDGIAERQKTVFK
jgi:predicted HicB family RNase H-like nuclease